MSIKYPATTLTHCNIPVSLTAKTYKGGWTSKSVTELSVTKLLKYNFLKIYLSKFHKNLLVLEIICLV